MCWTRNRVSAEFHLSRLSGAPTMRQGYCAFHHPASTRLAGRFFTRYCRLSNLIISNFAHLRDRNPGVLSKFGIFPPEE